MPHQKEQLFSYRPGPYGDVIKPWFDLENEAQKHAVIEHIEPSDEERIHRILRPLGFTTRVGEGMTERNHFVTTSSTKNWVPYHKDEVTIANRGLEAHLNIVSHTHWGNRAAALKTTIDNIDKYRGESTFAFETLTEVLIGDDKNEGNVLPTPNHIFIRNNQAVRLVLADFMLAKESLDNFKWYPKGKHRQTTGAMNARIDGMNRFIDMMDSSQITYLWQMAYQSTVTRTRFWANQYSTLVEDHDERVMAGQISL